jgi:hypothetical protein
MLKKIFRILLQKRDKIKYDNPRKFHITWKQAKKKQLKSAKTAM